jgi:hypothetical protein
MKEIVKNIKALSHREDLWEFIEERIGLMVDLSDENYSSEHLSNKKPKDKMGFAALPDSAEGKKFYRPR